MASLALLVGAGSDLSAASDLQSWRHASSVEGGAGSQAAAAHPEKRPEEPDDPRRRFLDRIEVRLTPVVVRVIDSRGRPILGLQAEDFRVQAGGEEMEVVSVDWISPEESSLERPPRGSYAGPATRPLLEQPAAQGRMVILFYQTSLQFARLKGQVLLRRQVRALLDSLHADDWTAVVAFDSRLRLLQDFSRDSALLSAVTERAAVRLHRHTEGNYGFPSLARALAAHEPARAASPEQALEVIGRALRDLPGEKILVYIGWGLGGRGEAAPADYELEAAVGQLLAARATVFVLDITEADFHSLESGLKAVARATGGTYEKTYPTPGIAMERLVNLISGYYVLYLDTSTLVQQGAALKIDLEGVKGAVFTRSTTIG